MDWIQFAIFLIVNLGFTLTLWLLNRAEGRADFRSLETFTKENILAIREEMKDFHGRLCAIEEKNRK
jgi:hypothetical protein